VKRTQKQNSQDDKKRKQTKAFTAEAQSRRETRNNERQSSQDYGCAGIEENEKKGLVFLSRSLRLCDSAVKWVLPKCFGPGLGGVFDPRRSEELL
jgi:hypothetical protein